MQKKRERNLEKQHPYSCHRIYSNNTKPITQLGLKIGQDRGEKHEKKIKTDRLQSQRQAYIHSTWQRDQLKSGNGLIIRRKLRTIARRRVGSNAIKNTWGSFRGNLEGTTPSNRQQRDESARGSRKRGRSPFITNENKKREKQHHPTPMLRE